MQAIGLRFATSASPGMRLLLRKEHFSPPPTFAGFCARHWHLEQRAIQGRYLFADKLSANCFLDQPLVADPSIARIAAFPGVVNLEVGPIEEIPEDPLFQPVFIVSAPRSGSTLLYELLAESGSLWSIGRESEGVIEGIPQLHPAYCGYESHRIRQADANVIHILRCGLIAEMRNSSQQRYLDFPKTQRPQRIRMLEKTPENALRVPLLLAAFPDAFFIYLVREVRQNVSSMVEAWKHGGFVNIPDLPGWESNGWHLLLPPGWQQYRGRSSAEIAAFQWASANQAILDDLAPLARERWMAVDYAMLIAEPEAVLRSICEFLKIPFDQNLARVAQKPLRISGTTIKYPSPVRWRYNHEFSEQVLYPYETLILRIEELRREMALSVRSKRQHTPVRFQCFIDESLETSSEKPPVILAENDQPLVVDPSFQLQFGVTIPLSLVRRTRFRERFLADYPIAWVEDPATKVLQPFWIPYRYAWPLRTFVAGEVVSDSIPAQLKNLLHTNRIITSTQEWERRYQFGDDQARNAGLDFANRDYCLLTEVFHPAHLRALGRYYRELIAQGDWSLGDAQVAGRYGWHNEHLARFFHHQLTDYIGRIVGVAVKPSYAYVSAYQGGAVLERHVDREQCEFTVSLLIERSAEGEMVEWPLYFDTPDGTIEVFQVVGEAVLFRGTQLPHYRPPLADGQTYMSLLLHYVPADFSRTSY